MAITVTTHTKSSFTLFAGRVLKVENVSETRNHSDTLDYTDNRATDCTYALVWLGTHGVPPTVSGRDGRAHVNWESLRDPSREQGGFDAKPRELEYWEQFAWVDCTNLFTWRGSDHREPEVDTEMGKGGEPLMWANYLAWQAHQKGLAEKAQRELEAAVARAREEKAKRSAKLAAKNAKLDLQKAHVEAQMVHTPTKGTTCTVDGFTGQVFWKGTKLYRGKWRGTVGLKDSKGQVAWIDVGHWAK